MTRSLGTYTFLEAPVQELQHVECERLGEVSETSEALAESVTEWNGTRARTWTITGNLLTYSGTTYLSKMETLEGVQDDGAVNFIDPYSVHDTSNTVSVYIAKIRWGDPRGNIAVPFVPFTIVLKEVLS